MARTQTLPSPSTQVAFLVAPLTSKRRSAKPLAETMEVAIKSKPNKNSTIPKPTVQTAPKVVVAALKTPIMLAISKVAAKAKQAVAQKAVAVVTPVETAEQKRGRGRPTNAEQGIAEPVYMEKMRRRAEKRGMTLESYMTERKSNRKIAASKGETETHPITSTIPVMATKSVKPPKALGQAIAQVPAVKAKVVMRTKAKAKTAAVKATPRQKAEAQMVEAIAPVETLALANPITETVHEVRIKHTNKLEKFTLHPANRKVTQAKVKNMIEEISKNNLLHLNPIIVDKEYRIINGQHRYFAAKALGLTIYYIQGDVTAKEMLDLNANQKSLVLKDYLDSYVTQGFQEYIKVNEFLTKHKIVLYNAIGLLSGRNSQPNSDLVNAFKNGEFKIKDSEHAERVLTIRDKMKEFAPEFYQQKNFTNAVAKVISAEGFDETRLDTRLKKNGHGQLHQAVTTDLYAEQILGVYNYGMSKPKHLVLS